MNLLDLIIFILLLLGAVRGYQKGFFYEVATFLGLIAGIYMAILVSNIAGNIISGMLDWNIRLVKIIVFIMVFILVVMIISMLGKLLTSLMKALFLGFINRLAGFFTGLAKWALILSVAFVVIDYFDSGKRIISEEMQDTSYFYKQLERLSDKILHGIQVDRIHESTFLVTY